MKILMIDDDLDLERYLVPFIVAEGHDVTFESDAEVAIKALDSVDLYDAVILDIMMLAPADFSEKHMETGIVIHNMIREVSKVIPIIVLSALSKGEIFSELKHPECTKFIIKPLLSGRDDFMQLLRGINV